MTKQLEALIAKIKKQTENFDTVVLKEDEANVLIAALEQRVAVAENIDRGEMLGLWLRMVESSNRGHKKVETSLLEEAVSAMDKLMKHQQEASPLAVKLHKRSVGEVMHMSGFSRDYAEGWCAGNDNAIHEIRAAGGTVEGE